MCMYVHTCSCRRAHTHAHTLSHRPIGETIGALVKAHHVPRDHHFHLLVQVCSSDLPEALARRLRLVLVGVDVLLLQPGRDRSLPGGRDRLLLGRLRPEHLDWPERHERLRWDGPNTAHRPPPQEQEQEQEEQEQEQEADEADEEGQTSAEHERWCAATV